MDLMVVESPTKIKTLAKLLGDGWSFAVTKGHLYDLPDDRMGLDEEYRPDWVPINNRTVGKLRSEAEDADRVYVASDPDREGEAIAWQVEDLVLDENETKRLRLESLTQSELDEKLADPGETDRDLVEAQWARRLLDRLAGYKISPFLVNAFKGKKLSAGRVQTPVLGKIVDRWEAVEAFEPETYYEVSFDWTPDDVDVEESFRAELIRVEDRPIGTEDDEELLTDEELANRIPDALNENGVRPISRYREETETYPGRPFDSSAMIQRASSWFNWPAGKTMNVAQSLYEKGLITYHRSDSNRLSRQACKSIAGFVSDEYGSDYHQWRGGGGGDQEGHEAIRPKYPGLVPEELHSVSGAERTLYSAIWQQTIQSQMVPAEWDRLVFTFEESGTESIFESGIRALVEPGFFRCRRGDEDPKEEEEYNPQLLDELEGLEDVRIEGTNVESSETTGPSHYTEGSLVSMMKEEGIGRPSTYGSTIERLVNRQYVRRDDRKILPTKRGRDVLYFLRRAVPRICEVDFTEVMESTLDEIAEGKGDWAEFVENFDEKLSGWIDSAEDLEPEGNAATEKELLEYAECPRCGGDLYEREGQYGPFVHCGSDDCDFSSNPPAKTYNCPECGRHMVKQKGRKSTVYHCIAHPECEGKRPVGKPNMTYEEFREQAPDCPSCGGTMEKRKGRWGKFWGCENYPECEETKSVE